jgi:UPF0148 protein
MDMDEDEAIRRITKLLEQGCTMLAAHHDCGAPLFRCEGEVICPVCSFEKAEVSSSTLAAGSGLAKPQNVVSETRFEGANRGKESMRGEGEMAKPAQRAAREDLAEGFRGRDASAPKVIAEPSEETRSWDDLRAAEEHLRDSLLRRLGVLTEETEKEQDLDRLKKQLECIEGLVRVLKVLEG